jgi:hypothetical protein
MGGPTVSILLNRILDNAEKEDLILFLSKVSNTVERSNPESISFWIENASPIGYGYKGEGLPFGVDFGFDENNLSDYEINTLKEHFNFLVKDEISILAFCSGEENHRILGHLALLAAEKYRGLIDLGGAITPPFKENESKKNYPYCSREKIRAFVNTIEGKICEVEYEVADGSKWIYHVADCTFMRNWLQNRYFHMIK